MVLRESYDLFDDKIVQSDLLGLFPKEMVQNVNCHDERNAILVAHVLPDKVAVPGCRFVGIDFCLLDIEHTQMRQVIAHCVFSRFISNAAGNNDKVLVPVQCSVEQVESSTHVSNLFSRHERIYAPNCELLLLLEWYRNDAEKALLMWGCREHRRKIRNQGICF